MAQTFSSELPFHIKAKCVFKDLGTIVFLLGD
jgi:hypothetical protein